MSDEFVKEGMGWVAFNDAMDDETKGDLLQKLKSNHPNLYVEWKEETKHLIEKWNIPA